MFDLKMPLIDINYVIFLKKEFHFIHETYFLGFLINNNNNNNNNKSPYILWFWYAIYSM